MKAEGHLPQITVDDDGNWICIKCHMKLFFHQPNHKDQGDASENAETGRCNGFGDKRISRTGD